MGRDFESGAAVGRPEGEPKRQLLVSKGWLQAVALVVLFGFFVLGLLAYRTYTEQPPIPGRVVDPAGQIVFTGKDVRAGQEVFLRNGLMEYGSIFGHGAYLGPDSTAEYLHDAALFVRRHHDPSEVALLAAVVVAAAAYLAGRLARELRRNAGEPHPLP